MKPVPYRVLVQNRPLRRELEYVHNSTKAFEVFVSWDEKGREFPIEGMGEGASIFAAD